MTYTITILRRAQKELSDFPRNPMFAYETPFGFVGVRMAKTIGVNDGWMGASLTFEGLREITLDKPLHLRYGLYIHSDMKSADAIEAMWKRFSRMQEP